MIEATLKDVERGSESLRKLVGNAKTHAPLFIRLANAWRDTQEQLSLFAQAQTDSIGEHTSFVEIRLPDGSLNKVEQFIDKAHKSAHLDNMKELRASKVELPRSKPIPWEWIVEAMRDKNPLEITAFDIASLDWLIEIPED